jgi:hypothetical protein
METPMCPKCGGEMKVVPAGTSKKTGKPYNAFYACKTWECGGTAKMTTDTPNTPQNAPQASTQRPAYDSFPKKDIKTTLDYKARQISGFQDDKQESMRLFSSGRDAVMIVTTMYKDSTFSDEQIKAKITEWRDWFYSSIYHMDEDTYKSLNVPF